MDMQLTEQPAKGQMLLRRDVLIAEEDHDVFRERSMDLVHCAVGQRFCKVDAADLGADDRRELVDADRLVGQRVAGHVPIARAILAAERTHEAPSAR
jgi:hypothetical protein